MASPSMCLGISGWMPTSGTLWHSLRDMERSLKSSRNPVNSNGLRNSADTAEGNTRILELPTSPVLTGKLFCTSQSDGNRRDNSPNTAGEVSPNGPNIGKILHGSGAENSWFAFAHRLMMPSKGPAAAAGGPLNITARAVRNPIRFGANSLTFWLAEELFVSSGERTTFLARIRQIG